MICTCSRGDKKPGNDHQPCINQAAEFQAEIKRLTAENQALKAVGSHVGYCPLCKESLTTNIDDVLDSQITCNNAECNYSWSYKYLVKG